LSSVTPSIFNAASTILIIYLAGLFISLLLLGHEIVKLVGLYRAGNKSFEQGYTLVKTGKIHSPFSFFRIIFTGHKQDYNSAQWALLMAHEKEHGRLLHSLDNLLYRTYPILVPPAGLRLL
jgi:hypothetical protein